jgi:signal transduction histidine kinase
MKNNKGIFWKVVFGFAIVACLLATTYYITYNNLDILKDNLSVLSQVNPKYTYRKEVIKKIDEAESYVKKYTVNKNEFFLEQLDTTIDELGKTMDELLRSSSDNSVYYENLMELGFYIKDKITVAEARIKLAKAYNSGLKLETIVTEISEKENNVSKRISRNDSVSKEKENFFSKLFSSKKNKGQPENEVFSGYQPPPTIATSEVKELIKKAEEKAGEKTEIYLKEMLVLMDKDDRIQDNIRAVSSALEKLEVQESIKVTNKLADETTNKTGDILSTLILTGFLIMLLFIIVVYFEVKRSEILRYALIGEKQSSEKLAKVKEEFLANMSHEIRTPMNVIMGFSDQLLKTDLTNNQQKLLLNIKRSSTHLVTVINEILDYSKMEAGTISLEKIPFEVKEIIEDVYESFKTTTRKNNVKLNYSIDDSVAKKIIGDPVRLKQILLNLIGNAVKFTQKGTIELICKVWNGDPESQTLLFEVKDTGVGIAADAQEKIFEQFTQADSSVTRKFGGTGLGLTITKKLVEVQGGEIGLKSELDKGSTFYFRITYPVSSDRNHEQVHSSSLEMLNLQILSGKRILIVDDDELNKALATYILENYDVDIDDASNGKEALEKITEENYDLVLMDLHMPEMGGIEVVSLIRKRRIDVPVIAITGNVLKAEKEKCINAGMNEYISKPYDESELLKKIINLLLTV